MENADSLRNSQHWLTQEDIANIARAVYDMHNEDGASRFFEVVGSNSHFYSSLHQFLPHLIEGRFSSLTFIVNLNMNHWTTVVITAGGGGENRLTAFYADSFGQRPNQFSRPSRGNSTEDVDKAEANNGMVMSYTSIVNSIRAAGPAPGIDFVDVSVGQQQDLSSCGIYALENASRINNVLESGVTDSSAVREALEEPISSIQLRDRYADALSFGGTAEKEKMVYPEKPPEAVSDHESTDSGEDSDDSLEHKMKKFKKERTMTNLRELLIAFLTHERSAAAFQEIWDSLISFETIPFDDEKVRRDVLQYVIDWLEEGADPDVKEEGDPVPSDFFHDASSLSQRLFGQDDIITVKLRLLEIFFTDFSARCFAAGAGASTRTLQTLFRQGQIPNPDTGTFIDTNLDEDGVRYVRYFYVLSLIHRVRAQTELAEILLQMALNYSWETSGDPVYIERRGRREADKDLTLNQLRILLEIAELVQNQFRPSETLSFLMQRFTVELQHKKILRLTPPYTSLLRFLVCNPGVQSRDMEDYLRRSPTFPEEHVRAILLFFRAKASLTPTRYYEQGLAYLEVGKELLQRYDRSNLPPHWVGRERYMLILERFRIIREAEPDHQLEAAFDFVSRVRNTGLESYADENYFNSLQYLVEGLDAFSREPENREKQAVFRDMTEYLINEFEIDRQHRFQNNLADLYEGMARNFYNYRGYLKEFLIYGLLSIMQEHTLKKRLPRDEKLQAKLVKVLSYLREALSVKVDKSSEAEKEQYEFFLSILFGISGVERSFLVLSGLHRRPERGGGGPASLESLSHSALGHDRAQAQYDVLIREIFQAEVVVEALIEVMRRLEREESFHIDDA